MSESQGPEDFAKLQQLLKLKRYEQPHPRYFNELPGQITARLRASETSSGQRLKAELARASWLQRVWRVIEGRPALSGVVTAGACGLLLLGGFLMVGTEPQPDLTLGTVGATGLIQHPAAAPMLATSAAAVAPIFATSSNSSAISPATGSLFSIPLGPDLQPQPVSFR
ncbi:MAG: hypothetical protein M9920_16885 [Verrucomicrobiae bacterium]|nr:hypothetical protein [Verrucomicrobiae bacterium]